MLMKTPTIMFRIEIHNVSRHGSLSPHGSLFGRFVWTSHHPVPFRSVSSSVELTERYHLNVM